MVSNFWKFPGVCAGSVNDSQTFSNYAAAIAVFTMFLPIRCSSSVWLAALTPLTWLASTLLLPGGATTAEFLVNCLLFIRLLMIGLFGFGARATLEHYERLEFIRHLQVAASLKIERELRLGCG